MKIVAIKSIIPSAASIQPYFIDARDSNIYVRFRTGSAIKAGANIMMTALAANKNLLE